MRTTGPEIVTGPAEETLKVPPRAVIGSLGRVVPTAVNNRPPEFNTTPATGSPRPEGDETVTEPPDKIFNWPVKVLVPDNTRDAFVEMTPGPEIGPPKVPVSVLLEPFTTTGPLEVRASVPLVSVIFSL